MITWPIFVALIFALAAVYFSIRMEKNKINETEIQRKKEELNKQDLIKRKERIANDQNRKVD